MPSAPQLREPGFETDGRSPSVGEGLLSRFLGWWARSWPSRPQDPGLVCVPLGEEAGDLEPREAAANTVSTEVESQTVGC